MNCGTERDLTERIAAFLRDCEEFKGDRVAFIPEDLGPVENEVTKAGVTTSGLAVVVAAGGFDRRSGSASAMAGDLDLTVSVFEVPKVNRKNPSAMTGQTANALVRSLLHWRMFDGIGRLRFRDYVRLEDGNFYVWESRFTVSVGVEAPPVAAQAAPEPEEILEGIVAARLSAAMPGWPVVGALNASADGQAAERPDTRIDVTADVASQDLDWQEGRGLPRTYSVRVTLHVAQSDDAAGSLFRDAARNVRAALAALLGDGCSALYGDGFSCDSFMLGGTETSMESDREDMAKTYNATVVGRYCRNDE